MNEINVEGVNWVVAANQGISEDDFVKCHIDSEGIYPNIDSKAKEKTLREAYKLMNPPKAKGEAPAKPTEVKE